MHTHDTHDTQDPVAHTRPPIVLPPPTPLVVSANCCANITLTTQASSWKFFKVKLLWVAGILAALIACKPMHDT